MTNKDPQKAAYIDDKGNLVDPKSAHPWFRFKALIRQMPAAILVVFFGLALCELVCIAGLIDALLRTAENSEWAIFIFLLVVIPFMMVGTLMVGTLLPKHESDIIPGSGKKK